MTKARLLEILRKEAYEYGISLDTMAVRTGLTPSKIARILEGTEFCSDNDLRSIARGLGYLINIAFVRDYSLEVYY